MYPIVNPYAKQRPTVPQNSAMGPQSQRRLSLQERTHSLQRNNTGYSNNKKRKGDQLTLTGEVAFDPIKDCPICKARHIGYSEPHRGHHPLCWNNKRTKGITSLVTLASNKESKQLKALFEQSVQRRMRSSHLETIHKRPALDFLSHAVVVNCKEKWKIQTTKAKTTTTITTTTTTTTTTKRRHQ